MIELDFHRYFNDPTYEKPVPEKLIEEADIIADSDHRAAVEHFTNFIPLKLSTSRNDAYYANVYNYIKALIYARNVQPEEANIAMANSGMLPGSGGEKYFTDALEEGVAHALKQDAAIERGVPSIFLSSMPRAASASLVLTISNYLQVPVFRVSVGSLPYFQLVDCFVKRFVRGGGLLHDHFTAWDYNLKILSDNNINDVLVLVRDPRAAAASLGVMRNTHYGDPTTEKLILDNYRKAYLPWLRNWIEADTQGKVKVHWIRSSDVTRDAESFTAVMARIFEVAGIPEPKGGLGTVEIQSANFVTGKADAWKEHVSEDAQKIMLEEMPSEMRDMLKI